MCCSSSPHQNKSPHMAHPVKKKSQFFCSRRQLSWKNSVWVEKLFPSLCPAQYLGGDVPACSEGRVLHSGCTPFSKAAGTYRLTGLASCWGRQMLLLLGFHPFSTSCPWEQGAQTLESPHSLCPAAFTVCYVHFCALHVFLISCTLFPCLPRIILKDALR